MLSRTQWKKFLVLFFKKGLLAFDESGSLYVHQEGFDLAVQSG